MPEIRYDGNAASAVKAAKNLAEAQKKITTNPHQPKFSGSRRKVEPRHHRPPRQNR